MRFFSVAIWAGLLWSYAAWALAEQGSIYQYRGQSHYGLEEPVLNLLFPRDGKVELGVGAVYSPYSTLMEYYALSGSLIYHINRRHAVEPAYVGYQKAWLTGFTKNELAQPNALQIEVPKLQWVASYFFSPYYSKMSVSPRSVAHFDSYFGLGFGITKTQELFANEQWGEEFTRPTASVVAGIRFLIPARWGLRLELRDLIHTQRNFNKESFGNNLQAMLMLSIFFGRFPEMTGT